MSSHIENIIIVGFGNSGREFFEELVGNDERITATITIVERAEKIAVIEAELGSHHRVLSFTQLTKVDAHDAVVVVAVPPQVMGDVLVRLRDLETRSIIIEKPGPIPFESSQPIFTEFARRGVRLYVSHQRQYADHFQAVVEAIKSGAIGTPEIGIVRLEKWDFLTAGTHWMALCHACFGAPKEAYGHLTYCGDRSKYGYFIEREGAFFVRHANGTSVFWSLGGPNEKSYFRMLGSNGHIDLKVHKVPLGSIHSATTARDLYSYGPARARLCLAAYDGEQPRVGCGIGDLSSYISLFEELPRNWVE